MRISENKIRELFQTGGQLDGATVHGLDAYGGHGGEFEGVEIFMLTKRGGFALLTLDALDGEFMRARFISEETAADADEADRRRIAELEERAAAIRADYPALQAIHAKTRAEAETALAGMRREFGDV